MTEVIMKRSLKPKVHFHNATYMLRIFLAEYDQGHLKIRRLHILVQNKHLLRKKQLPSYIIR